MERSLNGLGKVKTRSAITAQINVHTKILKRVLPEKVTLTKSSIEELKSYLVRLMAVEVNDALEDLYELIQCPSRLTGQHFVQQWAENDVRKWYEGVFECFLKNTDEFKMVYTSEAPSFMTTHEVLADIVSGDLEIHN